MPLNFSGQNLRGRNFKGQDLTGANFSDADIRGTDFTNAILQGANFTGAKAGLQKRWVVGQLIIASLVSVLSGALSAFAAAFVSIFLTPSGIKEYTITPGILILVVLLICGAATIQQGFTAAAFGTIAVVVAGAVAVASAFAVTVAGAFAVASAGAGAVAVAFAIAFAFTGVGTVAFVGAIAGVSIGVGVGAGAGGGIGAGAVILLSIYIGWRTSKGDDKFSLLRTLGVRFGAWGGTTFQGADLTNASFSKAILKSTDFANSRQQSTILTRVCWIDSHKLDRTRIGNSILASTAVRELLVTGNGYHKSFLDADLRGANLNGCNLTRANLKRADLSEATLQQASLAHANLTEVQAISTNFTQANLTGACLEAWNIDHTTVLDQVDCQYVYLLEQPNALGDRERRPHNPTSVFAPGDFTKLYTKIMNTIEILLRNGVNREAFAEAFQKLMQENPEISFGSIQSIEKKGNDVLLTLAVPENSDKAKISQDFLKPYEEKIRQLKAKVDELQSLRSADLKDIALALANQSFNITNQVVGKGKAVQENNDSSRKLNIGSIGGDFNASGQALNFGEMDISGQVTNTINQLPASPQPDEPGIKELLEQLHRAIESADDLKPEDKAEALKQVQALAEAGKDPAEAEKKNMAKSAIRWFKGMLTELAEPSAIAQLCKKLLPHIATIFGL